MPRVDGRQLIICARSILVISVPAACQSFTQNVRVSPWMANVEPSFITATGSAVRAVTQFLEELGNERLELIKLHQHVAVCYFGRRQLDRLARIQAAGAFRFADFVF